MNTTGIFFTFIVFLLSIALIFANSNLSQSAKSNNDRLVQETAFSATNLRFENIANEISTTKTGETAKQQSRIFPFDFTAGTTEDGNGWVEFGEHFQDAQSYRLEIETIRTFDALNLFKVFNESAQVNTDTNAVIKSVGSFSYWQGNDTNQDLNYIVMPACAKWTNKTEYSWSGNSRGRAIEKGKILDGCDNDFSVQSIKKIEQEITLDKGQTYVGAPTCTGGLLSGGTCKNEAFTGDKAGKFYASIRFILDLPECCCGNCPAGRNCNCTYGACDVAPSCGCSEFCGMVPKPCIENCDQTISAYIDYSSTATNSVFLPSGDAFPDTYYIMDSASDYIIRIINNHGAWDYLFSTKLTFNTTVDGLKYNNVNYSVVKKGFENVVRGS